MNEELRAIGLTDGEIAIYLALLRLGPSTNGPIARETGLQSSTVYYCLNRLIEKGLVGYVQHGARKRFSATDPGHLLETLRQKEEEIVTQRERISKIIPRLQAERQQWQGQTFAEVYEGFNGMQAILNTILQRSARGEVYEAFVIEQKVGEPERLRLIFARHNRLLRKKGVTVRLLANEQLRLPFNKIYGKRFLSTEQEIRYTREKTPVGITIFRNLVITHTIENGKPLAIVVQNPGLAESYRDYFYSVWSRAKP